MRPYRLPAAPNNPLDVRVSTIGIFEKSRHISNWLELHQKRSGEISVWHKSRSSERKVIRFLNLCRFLNEHDIGKMTIAINWLFCKQRLKNEMILY